MRKICPPCILLLCVAGLACGDVGDGSADAPFDEYTEGVNDAGCLDFTVPGTVQSAHGQFSGEKTCAPEMGGSVADACPEGYTPAYIRYTWHGDRTTCEMLLTCCPRVYGNVPLFPPD